MKIYIVSLIMTKLSDGGTGVDPRGRVVQRPPNIDFQNVLGITPADSQDAAEEAVKKSGRLQFPDYKLQKVTTVAADERDLEDIS